MLMLLPRTLDRIRSALALKAFGICFIAVHLPLIALLGYLLLAEDPSFGPVVIVCLGTTLAGTLLSIRVMATLLQPLDRIAAAMTAYGQGQSVAPLNIRRSDEVGRIAAGVDALIGQLDTTLGNLRRQATTDPLTALGNRRWLLDESGTTFARARRQAGAVAVCIFDLDHFKQINDIHGHAVGDIVLMAVAEICRQRLRPYDLIARWGGEEFCIVVSGTPETNLHGLAERLRLAIANTPMGPLPAGQVTASFGFAAGLANDTDFATLLRAADSALYLAKAGGRNRVVAAEPVPALVAAGAPPAA